VQYFSSPSLSYLSRPLGVSYESSPSTSADNVRALNNAANIIANWRQTVVPVQGGYTPATFTDNPLVAGVTQVKALHISEVRDAINRYRVSAGLSQVSWSTATTGTTIAATHITEMRAALQQALPSATFTDPTLVSGSTIKAVHIQELRNLLD
jgi:hypothetical protein